jgi:hypothetical protein
MLAKKPMVARDNMIDVPELEREVIAAPTLVPMKKMTRLL